MRPKYLKQLMFFWGNSIRPWWKHYQWFVIGGLGIVIFCIGYVGFWKCYSTESLLIKNGINRSWWDILYFALQLFILQSGTYPVLNWNIQTPIEIQVTRLLAPALLAYTTIQALLAVFGEQVRLLCLRNLKHHVVICGMGRKGFLLAKSFYGAGYRIVVIEQDQNNSYSGQCKGLGIIILTGNAADRELLKRARIDKAKYLFAVCGDDSTNVNVSFYARELVKNIRNKGISTCFIHINATELASMIREKEIATRKADAFRLEVFNVFESGARILAYKYINFSEMSGQKTACPHLLVIGLGRLGEHLIIHAAKLWQILRATTEQHLTITIIDKEAVAMKDLLCLRYPRMDSICNLIAHPMDVSSPEFYKAVFLYDAQGRCTITNAFICLNDDAQSLSTAFLLKQILEDHRIPIVVQMEHSDGLANILHGLQDDDSGLINIHPFPVLDRACKIDLLLGGINEILARAIHEEYTREQDKKGFTPQTNPSMVSWDELPENLKESNRYHADHISVKLKAIGCDITQMTDWDAELFVFSNEEIEFMAKMEHDRWVAERTHEGWSYAPGTKDLNKKTSPYMVPWEKLSEDIREIDRNLIRGLPSFLAKAGFIIYRLNRGT